MATYIIVEAAVLDLLYSALRETIEAADSYLYRVTHSQVINKVERVISISTTSQNL